MTMSNFSDIWLKDNLDEAKLAILEAEYALEMLPYTFQDRPLHAFIGWLFVRPIVFILKRRVARVEMRSGRDRSGSAIVPISVEKGLYQSEIG
jgi:hypothetical protein